MIKGIGGDIFEMTTEGLIWLLNQTMLAMGGLNRHINVALN